MRKFIFTLMLAIAGSVWTITEAAVQLPSLCDEWHLETYTVVDPDNPDYHEYTQRLAADTIIGGKQYRQLRGMREWTPIDQNDNNYLGALREGNNADIYYVPAGGTHEFLLYAFNVQVGDTLTNLWIGNYVSEPYGYKAKVTGVGTGKFKRIDLHVFDTDDNKGVDCWADTHWLDSIGRYTGPVWADPVCYAIDPAPEVICACKESRKVYARDAKCACDPLRLKSLCDTWNVLIDPSSYGCNQYRTSIKRLTTDVIINSKRYVRLEENNAFWGALREDENANIYFVPNDGSEREYLLYAFGAKVGDQLTNLWLGENCPDCYEYTATVKDISEDNPRVFSIEIDFTSGIVSSGGALQAQWIEGVGYAGGPIDAPMTPYPTGIDACAYGLTTVLCAYKDGKQVYASELSQEFGCKFDGTLPVTQATKWYGVLYEAYPYWPGFTEPRLSEANYSLQGDTIISGKPYYKFCGKDNNCVGAIRFSASGRQAYYVPIYGEEWLDEDIVIEKDAEYLLYDLNVNVGDVVKAFNSTVNLPCGREPLSDWTVLDEQTIDGRIHARVKGGPYDTETEWIEGVGTPYIIWSGLRDCQPTDGSIVRPYTLCAADNAGNILYSYNLEHIGVINECPNWSRITPDNPPRLPSLCDTWNVMVAENVMCGGCEEYHTYRHYLTTDTLIGEYHYRKLLVEGTYEGALREGDNKNIYCVPAGTTHEYLLYAFNVKTGDLVQNMWIGGSPSDSPEGYSSRVVSVTETTPRTFRLLTTIKHSDSNLEPLYIDWVEGVGLSDGPIGSKRCVGCADSRGYAVLCAYKDGELVYDNPAWDWCYYDSAKQPADTVALYWRSGDGPGSTTVTPVDPNQVVATLNDNLLTIREQSGEEVTYSLAVTPISHAPARHELPEAQKEVSADTFRNSVAVQLSQNGSYTLTLSKAGWENDIYGTFDYTASGLQPVAATDAPARKLLRNGQLLIQQGDKIFTLTGVQTK